MELAVLELPFVDDAVGDESALPMRQALGVAIASISDTGGGTWW